MTADELLRLPRGRARYQLMRGELRTEPLSSIENGSAAAVIGASLHEYVKRHGLGVVCIGSGFQLEHDPDTVFGADVAFVRSARVVKTWKYFDGPPDLAVEILDEREEKTADWLRGGTPVVIVVDPARRSVRIHRSGEVLNVTDAIAIDDVVPGWRLPLAEIFEDD